MSLPSLVLLAAAVLSSTAPAAAQDRSLETLFDNPPQSSGPWAWWHWCGNNVTREGITRDLEAMASAGFGGATMFNIQSKGTMHPVANDLNPKFGYRNEEYWNLLVFAAAEAKRLGMVLGAHNCTGYSTVGGPWIRPEQSMKKVVWTKSAVPEGRRAEEVELPQPETIRGFYRDIGRVTVGGTVYRFGYTSTGKKTHPAPPDVEDICLEADKMDAAVISWHWDNVLDGFLRHVPPSRPGFSHILIDSYEAGPSNWTDDFREQFTARRGYDPLPKLPALDGAFGKEENEAFRRDMDQTVRELYTERYYEVSYAKVKPSGYELHLEPYWGPFDFYEASANCDVPMTEFWLGYTPWGKGKDAEKGGSAGLWGAVGRAFGRPLVAAESFTACPQADPWRYAPRHMKRALDRTFANGINHLSLHDWVHQPLPERYKPGFSMGFWGTHFGENQTWFEPGKALFRYMQRCQALLQQGRQLSQALGLEYTEDPTDDAIGERDFLREVEAAEGGGVVVKSSGRAYPVLLVRPKAEYHRPGVAEKLAALKAKGVRVVTTKKEARELCRPVAESADPADSSGRIGAPVVVGREADGVYYYFCANTTDVDSDVALRLKSGGRTPRLFFPADGRKERPFFTRSDDKETADRTLVRFVLRANESVFVVFDQPPETESPGFASLQSGKELRTREELTNPWSVSFQKDRGAPEGTHRYPKLASWTESDAFGIRYFSGTATYETTFDWDGGTDGRVILDLGDVRDIAEAELNGVDLGVAWYAPFRVEATRALKKGANRLVVKVTNGWMNRLLGDRRLPPDTEFDKVSQPMQGECHGLGFSRFPDWLVKGGKSPSGRICWTTWDYFALMEKDPDPEPAGLLGPVRLLTGAR